MPLKQSERLIAVIRFSSQVSVDVNPFSDRDNQTAKGKNEPVVSVFFHLPVTANLQHLTKSL